MFTSIKSFGMSIIAAGRGGPPVITKFQTLPPGPDTCACRSPALWPASRQPKIQPGALDDRQGWQPGASALTLNIEPLDECVQRPIRAVVATFQAGTILLIVASSRNRRLWHTASGDHPMSFCGRAEHHISLRPSQIRSSRISYTRESSNLWG